MYLKRLELSGFKTFADHTTLEFGPGITAIVGPNGSGKSNIADAIIWCLGEQGLKSLRSAHSQDVIFTGSASRRRAGLGEVSLTLDNNDGSLSLDSARDKPLDFSEVTITRRVFRSGEGEYFINRVPCRLRDIHELFLDTGIGKHAYSAISQNEIDRILSVRSEDRREIFEQAAGIQRYRQRKNEAGRKLDRVCENLLRVNDIIHELETQLAPLAQQSEAAREYRRISKELFDLKLSLLVHQHQALVENLARAREREQELDKEIEAARTCSFQLAAQEVELRGQLQQVEERVEETRGLTARLASESERAEGRLHLTHQRIEDLQKQDVAAGQELVALEARLTTSEEELVAAKEQSDQLEVQAGELRLEIEAHERRLREETGTLRTTGDSMQEQRAEHFDTLRELADARNRLVQCESLLEAAQAQLARLHDQEQTLQARRVEVEERVEEAAREAAKIKARRDQLRSELAALETQEKAREAAAGELAQEEMKLRERLSAARSRHDALVEMERSHEGLQAGVRAVLSAMETGLLSGQYQAVADLVHVPRELEVAIEATLGPAAGDLVVSGHEEAKAAISFLKQTNGGRATFLPQSSIRVGPRPGGLAELANRPGWLGIAADLVSCEAGAEAIVEHLLGRVLVVETLDAALELSQVAAGWRSIVTVEGDLIRPWGAITGGSPGRSHLIGRAREIEELTVEQNETEQNLNRLSADHRREQEEMEAVRVQIVALVGELETVASTVGEAERLAEVLAENSRHEIERCESLAAEQETLSNEIGAIEQERLSAAERVQQLEARKSAAESTMEEVEMALQTGRDAREHLSGVTSELRVKLTAVEGDLRANQARREKTEQSRRLLSSAINDKQLLLTQLAESIQQAEVNLSKSREEHQQLRDHYQQAEQELSQQQEGRQQLLDGLAQNREAAAQNRAESEALQNRLHRSQLRTTQLESEIGFTERTLAEEYRISLAEAQGRAAPLENRSAAQEQVKQLQAQVDALGEVNLGSIEEYDRVGERLEFLGGQRADLEAAREDLQQAIMEIDREATTRFLSALEALQKEFQRFFVRLFGGGQAELILTDKEHVLESGIDVIVTVPGKKTRDLLQLSGGERALTAAAILFSLLEVKPSPFVILDEVDAPLDDSNVGRYGELLREFSQKSQFIIITHNKGTMEAADILYGITMEDAGVSKLIGVRLRDESEPRQAKKEQTHTETVLEQSSETEAKEEAA